MKFQIEFVDKMRRRKTTNDAGPSTNGCNLLGNFTAQMLSLGIHPVDEKPQEKLTPLSAYPLHFDVRDKFGKLCPSISRAYNQGQCKSGWAVSVASVISDRICIKTLGRNKIMLSAQNLLSCCHECCGCNGGAILNAWHWVMNNGLVTGSVYKDNNSCMPYKIPPAHPNKYMFPGYGGQWATANLAVPDCYTKCKDGTDHQVTKILGYELWSKSNEVVIMNQLMVHGPLQVSMHLYDDFRYYKEGIYIHKTGKFEGEHGVKLIGWGVWKNTEYWLAMNSFGNNSWGISGTFMVPRNGKDNTEFGYAIISPILMGSGTSRVNIFEQKMLIVFIILFYC